MEDTIYNGYQPTPYGNIMVPNQTITSAIKRAYGGSTLTTPSIIGTYAGESNTTEWLKFTGEINLKQKLDKALKLNEELTSQVEAYKRALQGFINGTRI
jgi:hypothetical protein